MNYEEKNRNGAHHIVMEDRARITASGVEDVDSFDENGVTMLTSRGTLVVRGRDLHIDRLSIDKGELNIEGIVDSLQYIDEAQSGGFWARLFR
ncbi:MAG: YabP/YqfC family sporulation protein [Oscillospiraceae bacterium]|nr:YabP/YqfC family sporulation protein [Oscillospiraceae bacterium]